MNDLPTDRTGSGLVLLILIRDSINLQQLCYNHEALALALLSWHY